MDLTRLFEVASQDKVSLMAREIYTLLLKSTNVSRSLDAALRILYDSGSSDAANSRTIALVSRSIYVELLDRDEDLAEEFRYSLTRLTGTVFVDLWHADTLPPCDKEARDDPEFQPPDAQLGCISSFISDLYAMGLMPENWLSEFALFITEVFMHRDQLSILEALLSRATSYMGEKLPLAVYLKVASNVRRRCHLILRHNEMTRQELALRRLLRALIRDCWSEHSLPRHSSIPYQHVVNDDYNCDMMMLDNIDDLEELYKLEGREQISVTSVSDSDSVVSSSVSTDNESPEGLRLFKDLEGSETSLSDVDSEEATDKSRPVSASSGYVSPLSPSLGLRQMKPIDSLDQIPGDELVAPAEAVFLCI